VTSATWKEPVDGPVTIRGVNLAGDDQADRRVHGGPDKAVYAYAIEDYDWWATRSAPKNQRRSERTSRPLPST
jgi:MOSC domain-containing protein YiiM